MKESLGVFFFWVWAWAYAPPLFSYALPRGFVYLHQIDPSIHYHIGFATSKNFTGHPLKGYAGTQVICTREAALALAGAQKRLKKVFPYYSLIVEDAYRPVSAVQQIQRWALHQDVEGGSSSSSPYAHRRGLLGRYIGAKKSSHSRGSTFDIFIMDERNGKRLDYGPTFFGYNTGITYRRLSIRQYYNRYVLRSLMVASGFKPYDHEFWHFTLSHEPFPKTYFNFEIRNQHP